MILTHYCFVVHDKLHHLVTAAVTTSTSWNDPVTTSVQTMLAGYCPDVTVTSGSDPANVDMPSH